jgi:mannose/fructose/N-acetylgalactosamine-specific phosphotransferase system component IID
MNVLGQSIDISSVAGPLLGLAVTVIGSAITLLLNKIGASVIKANKAQGAMLRVAAIETSLLQKGWTTIGPEIQKDLADGKLDAAETARIEQMIGDLAKDNVDAETLTEIGTALGLPLAGIIAKIAAGLIGTWTAAHDPGVNTTSNLAFPIAASPAAPDPMTAGG